MKEYISIIRSKQYYIPELGQQINYRRFKRRKLIRCMRSLAAVWLLLLFRYLASCKWAIPAGRRVPFISSQVVEASLHINNQPFIIINSILTNSYFVSHRTHRNEDLGVDHIFLRPQYPTSHSVSTTKTPCLFVKETTVLPTQISCSTWPEAFTISDHRPVISTMVFGEKSESLK